MLAIGAVATGALGVYTGNAPAGGSSWGGGGQPPPGSLMAAHRRVDHAASDVGLAPAGGRQRPGNNARTASMVSASAGDLSSR
jgi:hypothetical protein